MWWSRRWWRGRRYSARAFVDKLSTEEKVAPTGAILVAVVVPSSCVQSGVRKLVASRRSETVVEGVDRGMAVVLGKRQALVCRQECLALARLHVGANYGLDRRRRGRRAQMNVRAANAGGSCSIPPPVPSSGRTRAVTGEFDPPATVPGASTPWNARGPPRFSTPARTGDLSAGAHVDRRSRNLGWVRQTSAPVRLAPCKRGGSRRVLPHNKRVVAHVSGHLPHAVLWRVRRRR